MTTAAIDPTTRVADQIRDAIQRADFVPGQRLVEADLSEQFEAPRAAVRVALLTLSSEGLVERLPHRGARVRAITLEEAIEIVEVRLRLESYAVRRAAERLDAQAAERLTALRAEILRATEADNLPEYVRLHQRLDHMLDQLSGHEVIADVLGRLRVQYARHQFRLSFLPGRAAASVQEHMAIIDAVLSRDGDAAEAATIAHLSRVLSELRALDPATVGGFGAGLLA